jgi:hypothetical protein
VDRPRRLEQSIGQSGFAVIDVRDDAEIARQFDCHESRTMLGGGCSVNRTPCHFEPDWHIARHDRKFVGNVTSTSCQS